MTVKDIRRQKKEKKRDGGTKVIFSPDFFLAHCTVMQSENSKSRTMTKASCDNTTQEKLLRSAQAQSIIVQL